MQSKIPPPIPPKVFGVGFHKTGTSSLRHALSLLGHRVTGPDGVGVVSSREEMTEVVDDRIHRYDAFQDNPYPISYKYIDNNVKNSKFILTVRDKNEWIRSVVNHFGEDSTSMREYIYGEGMGSPKGNEEVYVKRYERHNQEVKNYFAGRDDFVVMNIMEGDGYEKICSLLGIPTPPLSFPHKHARRKDKKNEAMNRNIRKIFRWTYYSIRCLKVAMYRTDPGPL